MHIDKIYYKSLLFIAFFFMISLSSFAQITINVNKQTIKQAIKQIEKNSEYSFFYEYDLPELDKVVSVRVKNEKIESVLNKIFQGTKIKYVVRADKQVTLSLQNNEAKQKIGKTASGVVVDDTGMPVIGATVAVSGTGKGTITDINGQFSIEAPEGAFLDITYVGYVPAKVRIENGKSLRIVIAEDTQKLDEVVVVAYGSQKKVNLTGSVASVNLDAVGEKRALTNISQALSGAMSGLLVTQSSGEPGSDGGSLMIRGQGTLNNSSPLIIVDGVIGAMSDVNPNDVASVSVLKDAASSSIYGSRAANGVVLITTKQGSKDKLRVSYNGYIGSQTPTFNLDIVDNYADYMDIINKASENADKVLPYDPALITEWRENSAIDPILYPNTDWFSTMFSSAMIQNHNLQASGGTDKMNYLLSIGYLQNEGSLPGSTYRKISFRSQVNAQMTRWMKIGASINGYRSIKDNKDIGSMLGYISNTSPGVLPRHPDGRLGGNWVPGDPSGNPMANIDENSNNRTFVTRILGKLDAELTLMKGLTWNSSVAVTLDDGFTRTQQKKTELWDFKNDIIVKTPSDRTKLENEDTRYYRVILDSYLKYHLDIQKHIFDFTVGYNQEYEQSTNTKSVSMDLLSNDTPVMNATANPTSIGGTFSDRALRSYFGRVGYNFMNRYLVEANLRYDGSSKFSKDGRWGLFPSFSAGWRISEESFFKKRISFFDNLKIRASWGKLGNNRTDDYGTQSLYKSKNTVFGDIIAQGAAPSALANRSLKWETTTMTNIGLDMDIFNNRLNFVADFFYKKTDDILIKLPVPLVLGGLAAPNQNAGIVSNRGVELSFNWRDKIGQDFSYGVSGNYTFVRNKVDKYRGDVATYPTNKILKEGLKINQWYVREVECIATQEKIDEMLAAGYVFRPSTPRPGDFIYKDQQHEGEEGYKIINDDDRVVKGNSVPEHFFGFSLNAEYKGIDFSVLFQGVAGIDSYYQSNWYTNVLKNGSVINKKFLNGWSKDNPNSTIPALTIDDGGRNTAANDFWLQNASFLRMKNIQLGYTLPASWTKNFQMQRVRFYVSAENLLTITGYEGMDPEIPGTGYPVMKKIVGGISISF